MLPYEDDPDYLAWLQRCAEHCSCCQRCSPESPCAAVFAGGFCDLFECTCDADEWDGPDYDDEELTT